MPFSVQVGDPRTFSLSQAGLVINIIRGRERERAERERGTGPERRGIRELSVLASRRELASIPRATLLIGQSPPHPGLIKQKGKNTLLSHSTQHMREVSIVFAEVRID